MTEKLKIVYVKVEDLVPWDGNPKLHDQEGINKSVKDFGPRRPIIIQKSTNRIVAGHGTLEGYKEKGMKTVPVTPWDCTDEEAEAFMVVDNELTIRGGWDETLLADLLLGIQKKGNLEKTGFSDEDLEKLLPKESKPKPETEFTTELLETHQYVLLYFDNEIDWTTAKEVLGIKTVKRLNEKLGDTGLGRVIPGSPVIKRLRQVKG